jgi:condensin complex subunit 1
MWELDKEKEKALATLFSVLQLDLVHLWRSNPEEEFIQMFSKVCLKMMENPANLRITDIKKKMFSILGVIAKNYGLLTQLTFSIVNGLLCKFEHAGKYLVELMVTFVREYDLSEIVGDVLREIGKLNEEMSPDNAASKGVCIFLRDMAEKLPQVVLPSVSVLKSLLEGKVSTVIFSNANNSVLSFT